MQLFFLPLWKAVKAVMKCCIRNKTHFMASSVSQCYSLHTWFLLANKTREAILWWWTGLFYAYTKYKNAFSLYGNLDFFLKNMSLDIVFTKRE